MPDRGSLPSLPQRIRSAEVIWRHHHARAPDQYGDRRDRVGAQRSAWMEGRADLRKETPTGEAAVGFTGAMARIMTMHQEGLRDTVTRDPNSSVQYPARQVLGFPESDRNALLDIILEQLTE